MLIRSLPTSTRLVSAIAGLVLVALGTFVCPLWAEEPGGTTRTKSVPESRPTSAGVVVQWWEQGDIVEAIGLRPEQVEALTVLWGEALEARTEVRAKQTRLFADFTEALRSNATDERAVLVDRLAESAAALARLPAELMDRGIAILDLDQHGRIAEQFPWIFQRSWMGRLTARERRLETRDRSLRIQPKRTSTKGEEHE